MIGGLSHEPYSLSDVFCWPVAIEEWASFTTADILFRHTPFVNDVCSNWVLPITDKHFFQFFSPWGRRGKLEVIDNFIWRSVSSITSFGVHTQTASRLVEWPGLRGSYHLRLSNLTPLANCSTSLFACVSSRVPSRKLYHSFQSKELGTKRSSGGGRSLKTNRALSQ